MTTPASPQAPKSNKKMLLLLGGGGAAVVLLLCVCICSGLLWWHFSHGSIVGKWKSTDGSTMEFKSDGTFVVTGGAMSINGTYTTSGNKITMTMSLFGATTTESGEYSISGNELSLTKTENGKASTEKFTRM